MNGDDLLEVPIILGEEGEWDEPDLRPQSVPTNTETLMERPVRKKLSDKVRRTVLAQGNHQCAHCKRTESLEIDHVIPFSHGGTDDLLNLQVLCRWCNAHKHARRSPLDADRLEKLDEL